MTHKSSKALPPRARSRIWCVRGISTRLSTINLLTGAEWTALPWMEIHRQVGMQDDRRSQGAFIDNLRANTPFAVTFSESDLQTQAVVGCSINVKAQEPGVSKEE